MNGRGAVRILLAVWLSGLSVVEVSAQQRLEPTETGETGLMTIPTTQTLPPGMVSLGAFYRTEVGSQTGFEARFGQLRDTTVSQWEFVGTIGVLAEPGLELSLQIPYVSFQNEQRASRQENVEETTANKLGDMRIGPKFRLFQEGQSPMPFSLAISGQALLPTGSKQLPAQLDRNTAFNGDEVGGDVMAVIDKNLLRLPGDIPVTMTLNIGGLFPSKPNVFRLDRQTEPVFEQLRRKGFPDVDMSTAVEFAAGLKAPLWVHRIGTLDSTVEYRGNTGTINEVDEYQAVLTGFRYTLGNGLMAQGSADFGLTNSVADYSVLAGIAYSGPQPPRSFAEPGKEKIVYLGRVIQVETIAFQDVNFEFDKAALTDVGRSRCYLAGQKVKDGKNVKIEIAAHTDYIGTEDYGRKLGAERAEAVKAELVRLGVDPASISAVSFGEDTSLVEVPTPWTRAVSRRVGFVVVGEPGGTSEK